MAIGDKLEGAMVATLIGVLSDVYVKVLTEERLRQGLDMILDPIEDALAERVDNDDVIQMVAHTVATIRLAFGVPDND